MNVGFGGGRAMEIIMEIVGGVLELILDGVTAGVTSRRVPLPLRILLAALLVAPCVGVAVVLFVLAFRNKSLLLLLVALGVLALFALAAACIIKHHERKRS